MADVRGLLDCFIDEFPRTLCLLSVTASIIHILTFESVVIKIQHENSVALSHKELKSVKMFKEMQVQHVSNVDLELNLSFSELALKQMRRNPA